MNEFALRRGHVYGTALIDMDTHQPIALLDDRNAETLTSWIREHTTVQGRSSVEVICRDRAGPYAQGAHEGTPQAQQVADRWHLWKNLTEHVEHAVGAHRRSWNNPDLTWPDPTPPTSVPSPATAPPPDPPDSPGLHDQVEQPGRLATRTRDRWDLIHAHLAQNLTTGEIARRTGLSRNTVRRYARAQHPSDLERGPRSGRGQVLDAHRDFLREQWEAGITNAARLFALLLQRGYQGSATRVREYVHPWRTCTPPASCPARPGPPTTRQVTTWICTRPGDLGAHERTALGLVRGACPDLDRLVEHVRSFADMLTGRHGERLNNWIATVQADDQPQLHSYVRGLLADHDAVRAGLSLPHSSGPVEGNINRLKMIKRKCYGRAGLPLLRKLILLGP